MLLPSGLRVKSRQRGSLVQVNGSTPIRSRTNLITSLQMGDTATGRTYDIDFDDVAVSPTSP